MTAAVFADPVIGGLIAAAVVSITVVTIVLARIVTDRSDVPLEDAVPRRRSRHRMNEAFDGSPVLRRAIEVTANLAERRGTLGSVERSLRAADIPMRPAEVIFAYCLLAVIVPTVSIMLLRSTTLIILSFVIFVMAPPLGLRMAVSRRRKKFIKQLPDTLITLAGRCAPAARSGKPSKPSRERCPRRWDESCARSSRKCGSVAR